MRNESGYERAVEVLSGTPTLENVHAEQHLGAAYYFELSAAPIVSGLTARNNAADQILIQGGTLSTDRTWNYGGLPIHLASTLVLADAIKGHFRRATQTL